MNPIYKSQWLKALKSSKYKLAKQKRFQVRYLRNENNEYSCLGILADIIAPEKWEVLRKSTSSRNKFYYPHCNQACVLAPEIWKEAGFTNEFGEFFIGEKNIYHKPWISIAHLDSTGTSKKRICEFIKKYL